MTKLQFETSLRMRLNDLPESEINRYVEYYKEMIDDRMDEGMDEETAVADMGHLDDIEARIRAERQPPVSGTYSGMEDITTQKKKLSNGALTAIIICCVIFSPLLIGLLAAAVGIVIALVGSLFGILAAAAAIYISFYVCVAAGFGIMFISIFSFTSGLPANGMFMLGAGFFLAGISLLLIIAMNRLLALLFRSIGRLFAWIDRKFAKRGSV